MNDFVPGDILTASQDRSVLWSDNNVNLPHARIVGILQRGRLCIVVEKSPRIARWIRVLADGTLGWSRVEVLRR